MAFKVCLDKSKHPMMVICHNGHLSKIWCPNLPFWGGQNGQKSSKIGKITLFYKLKELGCLFLFLPPFKMVSNIFNNWLHQVLCLGVPKWAKKWSKMSKITLFSKLKELACLFLFLYPHFPTHWFHLKWFQIFSEIGYPRFWSCRCQNGPKMVQNV